MLFSSAVANSILSESILTAVMLVFLWNDSFEIRTDAALDEINQKIEVRFASVKHVTSVLLCNKYKLLYHNKSVNVELVQSSTFLFVASNMLNYITTRSISRTPQLKARLIKFRYGPARDQQTSSAQHSGAGDQQKGALAAPGEVIYDFQIPQRWRRKPLDEEEIAVINNGGPL